MNNPKPKRKIKLEKILSDEKRLTAIIRKAVRETVKSHKLTGDPLAVVKNGKVVWVEA